jgi:multidrug efflux pump subunit AcrB
MLVGLATTAALLQVVRIRELRAQGVPRLGAILQSNTEALRPIAMITLTSLACALPWLSGSSALLLGPLFMLLATPVIYTYVDDLRFGASPAPQPVAIDIAPLGAE